MLLHRETLDEYVVHYPRKRSQQGDGLLDPTGC
jgi:hypothetical protein